MTDLKYKHHLDSGGSLKLPGETNTEFGKVVHEYLKDFTYFRVEKSYAVREQLYQWCAINLGVKYKDWFIIEGGQKDKWWTVNIKSPKRCTLFALRWANIVIDSVDKVNR